MLRALAYLLLVAVLLVLVGVVGVLAGPLAAFLAAVLVAVLLLEGWMDYRPTGRPRASRPRATRRATPRGFAPPPGQAGRAPRRWRAT